MVKCVIIVAAMMLQKGTVQMCISNFLIVLCLGPQDKKEKAEVVKHALESMGLLIGDKHHCKPNWIGLCILPFTAFNMPT